MRTVDDTISFNLGSMARRKTTAVKCYPSAVYKGRRPQNAIGLIGHILEYAKASKSQYISHPSEVGQYVLHVISIVVKRASCRSLRAKKVLVELIIYRLYPFRLNKQNRFWQRIVPPEAIHFGASFHMNAWWDWSVCGYYRDGLADWRASCRKILYPCSRID